MNGDRPDALDQAVDQLRAEEALSRMVPEAFRKVVEDDIRSDQEDSRTGQPKAQLPRRVKEALRSPEILPRFYSSLSALQKSVEGQLAASAADHDSKMARMRREGKRGSAAYEEAIEKHKAWRASALRFKTGVEEKMIEVGGLLRQADSEFFADRVKEERNVALARVRELEEAIRVHREHECDHACDDECVADAELWKVIS